MNPINTEMLTALQELILMAESMKGCEGIYWRNAKKAVRNAEAALANPPIPEPAVSTPGAMPPVPDGYRYAGRLRDHVGPIDGMVWNEGDDRWTDHSVWEGMKGIEDDESDSSGNWHVAVKI